ncbi:MAG TPA: hypothetical protein VML19_11065 [Verrucomicrobiae bacterium]|nr:hypothetical protein [Verrucomicrobiae bacterium]
MQVKSLQPLASLQAAASSQQGPTLTTRGGYQISTPAGTDEVVVQLNNKEVLRITLGVNMTIKTLGTLTLSAANIDLRCTNNLTIGAGNNLDLRAAIDATVRGGNNLELKSDAGDVSINGSTVNIN